MSMFKIAVACAAASTAGVASGQVYFSDFEADDGGFVGTGDWEHGIPIGADGTVLGGFGGPEPTGGFSGDFVWGTVLGGLHNASTTSSLTLSVDATGYTGLTMDYLEWLDSGGNTFDTAEVFVNGDLQLLADGGPTSGWRSVMLDLSAYDNSMLDIEFRFTTTTVVERVGWYIDDVGIRGVPAPSALALLGLGGFVASRRRR
ncbi:MAG: PEP-CTERM sorting domain-containing protein [Phycisphaerales bacterium JB052]